MMPVYFHLESHLWIFYLFLFNGALIQILLRHRSNLVEGNYRSLTNSLEASMLAAFFISLSFNAFALLIMELFNQDFSLMKVVLPFFSACLLLLIIKLGVLKSLKQLKLDFNFLRLILYLFVFVILFYNGGLIELPADSWWHMSLAKKIGLASSFNPEMGHLTGEKTRYYPPLWHANLAMASIVSGESISVLWNSFTAWGGVLKVMAFFLLAYALSGNRSIAVLSSALFVLLPGMGDSYLRVSAWPSHISYTAMFCAFFVCFWMIDNYEKKEGHFISSTYQNLVQQKSVVLVLFVLFTIMMFVHQLELIWVYFGVMNYLVVLMVCQYINKRFYSIEGANNDLLTFGMIIAVAIGLGASGYAFVDDWKSILSNADWMLVCLVMFGLFSTLSLICACSNLNMAGNLKIILLGILALLVLMILFSIDFQHLFSLVQPELAYTQTESHERPLLIQGYFGAELKLPSWNLQLRPALLYSGLLSLPLSLVLAILKPSRLTLFVSANALVAFLFCVSPYLYRWLAGLLSYHSPWRVATLIFHPIIIAYSINLFWEQATRLKAQ